MTKKSITTSRDSFIFYRSFYESIKELPKEQRDEVNFAIMEYQFNNNEIELIGVSKAIFTLIKPQLKANNTRYDNGCKGGRPKTKLKPKDNLNETKQKPNKNVNDNDNKNVNKKEEFILSCDINLQEPLRKWLEYRKDLKKEDQWIFQYKKLSSLTNHKESVENSIGQGYKGLFEAPKSDIVEDDEYWLAKSNGFETVEEYRRSLSDE